jgi:acyl-CoA synthetase (AMP-forming)/AMP-acid ligase II
VAIRSPGTDGRTLSHNELKRFIVEAPDLAAYGVAQGDRVCAVLPNGPECAMAYLVFSRTCTYAPLNVSLTSAEFAFELEDMPAADTFERLL